MSRRPHAAAWLGFAVSLHVAGCGPGGHGAAPPAPLAEVVPVAPAAVPVDRGRGLVYLEADALGAEDGDDSLVVRTRPADDASIRAVLVRDADWTFHLLAGDAVRTGALEFGYEELALPVVTLPGEDGWGRVRYGYGASGESREGWVRSGAGQATFEAWSERLPGLPLYFEPPPSGPVLFRTPGGEAVVGGANELPPPGGYILHPLESRGDWLRVEVVAPSDYCAEVTAPRRDTAWIRYLDAEGRPTVWYYTRGC